MPLPANAPNVVRKHLPDRVLLLQHTIDRFPWEQWYLLQSDEHWDNQKCDLALLKKHHDQAVERGALILKFGDTFCAMQGKYDPRSNKNALREEHKHGDYLDRLVATAANWYAPYANHIAMFGDGNHETGIRGRHETDLLERLIGVLNDRHGCKILHSPYSGWVRFLFRYTTWRESKTLWYTHGYGGGGPVTKDMIQRARQMVYVNGADIMVSGHTHDSWSDKTATIALSPTKHVIQKGVVRYVKTGTYKDAYDVGEGGFEVEKGHPPKPLGGTWLRFHKENSKCPMGVQVMWAE